MTRPDDPPGGPAPTRGAVRAGRVAGLGGASLILASGAHLVGGGHLPTFGVLLFSAFLLGLTATTLTARRCRLGPLLTVLSVQQVLLHLLFDATAGSAGCASAPVGGFHAAHGVMQMCDPAAMASMTSMTMPGWSMWAAHAAATLATAWVLARGEAWLWRVADEIVRAAAVDLHVWPASNAPDAALRRPGLRATRAAYRTAAPRAPPLAVVFN